MHFCRDEPLSYSCDGRKDGERLLHDWPKVARHVGIHLCLTKAPADAERDEVDEVLDRSQKQVGEKNLQKGRENAFTTGERSLQEVVQVVAERTAEHQAVQGHFGDAIDVGRRTILIRG